jgi:hypothetical protein
MDRKKDRVRHLTLILAGEAFAAWQQARAHEFLHDQALKDLQALTDVDSHSRFITAERVAAADAADEAIEEAEFTVNAAEELRMLMCYNLYRLGMN